MGAVEKWAGISLEDYLEGELVSPVKHEFVAGDVHAMAGGSNKHNQIAFNGMLSLGNSLKGSRCRPFNSDTKVRVDHSSSTSFYYPDFQVVCDQNPGTDSYQSSPVIIAEVLSPSTRRIDLSEKLLAYFEIPSLRVYLIIDSIVPEVTVHRRDLDGVKTREFYEKLRDVIDLPEVGASLSLFDLYEGLTFPDFPTEEG